MRFILASGSPRRKDILSMAGYRCDVVPSMADEITDGETGAELARLNAIAKARDVYSRTGDGTVVLGADTVVCFENKILGKPKDDLDAEKMLKLLSGSTHSVVTGYAVIGKDGEKSGFCETLVRFRALSDAEIASYVATGEPRDKAGSYGIQEKGGLFAEGVEGDFLNVIGLPVASVYPVLAEFGIKPEWITD